MPGYRDEKFHAVNIKDTSVSMNYPGVMRHTVSIGRGFLLVFSLNNARSFYEAIELWEYIKTHRDFLTRNRRCIRRQRIDEAYISTPVALDQRASNSLEEAVRTFTAMQSRCRSSRADVTFRRPMPVFRVVQCSSVHCFQTRITVELFYCTRVLKADNPPLFKLRNFVGFFLYFVVEAYLGDNAPVLLVGNKKDLTAEREVSEETVNQTIGNVALSKQYREVTAHSITDINKLFDELIIFILELEKHPHTI
ncbi:uncharacterized protein TNCV_2828121 [Trichonephila clavipes]|nr:uncharacterized protein TNCV_2828121 [Trichonephila clavipes]